MQSMLMEHKQSAIIWSEPLDHCKIHECIANQLRAFISRRPFERFFFSKRQQRNLSAEWVPSLYLDVDFLLNAHRGFFGRPFGEFDRAIDRSNCGIKEARPTIDRVMHFRVRHPRCKIVILYRNPYDADLSRRHVKAGKFRRRSDDWVKTADADDQHWPETTHSFIKGHERVNDPLIRYEDLDNPVGIDRLSDYLAWPVSRSSILRRRDLAKKQERSVTLARLDKAILDFATGRTRKDAGY